MKLRLNRSSTLKVSGLLLIIAALITVPVYAMWSDQLKVNVTIKMISPKTEIGSYRGFILYHCPCHSCVGVDDDDLALSDDAQSLHFYFHVTYHHHHSSETEDTEKEVECGCHHLPNAWIGIVLENNGDVPVKLVGISVVAEGNIPDSWNTTSYFYGPIKTGIGNKPFWGNLDCRDLPIDGYVTPPMELGSGEKAVIWTFFDVGETGNFHFVLQPLIEGFNTE